MEKTHWLVYTADGQVAVMTQEKKDAVEEQELTPGSLLCECDCDAPFGHVLMAEAETEEDH